MSEPGPRPQGPSPSPNCGQTWRCGLEIANPRVVNDEGESRIGRWARLWTRFSEAMNPPVWLGSAGVVVVFVFLGGFFSEDTRRVFSTLQAGIVEHLGWFYVLVATAILGFMLWLVLGPYGHVRLGPDDAEPEFGYFGWLAMLFSAGMGTGLVFWGVAEPLSHFVEPPLAEARSAEALGQALQVTFFHWGLHPWAVYTLFALAIGYFHFRHGLPLAPRSMLYPLLGERIRGWIGHLVDILCTVGTLFGVATSLGLGAKQINVGIARFADLPSDDVGLQIGIIFTITAVATTSVVLGIDRGVQRLSSMNMLLALAMLGFVFVAGPTTFVLDGFVNALGRYVQELPYWSLRIDPRPESTWQQDWTLFYWSWWISWSPFVGIFVARISYGRTLRQIVANVLFVPTVVTFFWLATVGGTGLHLEWVEGAKIAESIRDTPAIGLHRMLEELPLPNVTSVAATLLIVVFFITSSDSGSLVDDMVTSGGHPDPPKAQRVFWAVSEGTVAGTLLYAGGLQALRTASLQSGLPMAVLLLFSAVGLKKALDLERDTKGVPKRARLRDKARDDS